MEMNNKKTYLYRIILLPVMLLFAACQMMNVFFGSNYYIYESLDKTAGIEKCAVSETIAVNVDCDNTACFEQSFNHSKNICPNPIIAATFE